MFREFCGISSEQGPLYPIEASVPEESSSRSWNTLSSRTFKLSPVTWDLALKVTCVVGLALLFGLGCTQIASVGFGFPLNSLNTIAVGVGSSIVGGLAGYLIAQLIIKYKKDKSEDLDDLSDTDYYSDVEGDVQSNNESKNDKSNSIEHNNDYHKEDNRNSRREESRTYSSSRAQGNQSFRNNAFNSIDPAALNYYRTKNWTKFSGPSKSVDQKK